ncbi:MAG: hypothetical protein ABEJ56_00510 [Candidatus Nanohaloarchaea archaeon]
MTVFELEDGDQEIGRLLGKYAEVKATKSADGPGYVVEFYAEQGFLGD